MTVSNEFGSNVITKSVEIDPELIFNYTPVLCSEDSIEFNGVTYSITNPNGYELLEGAAANGCDSVLIINIQNGDNGSDLFATICEGEVYDPNGLELSEAGVYTFVETNSFGCDSTITLNLEVQDTYLSILNDTILQGEVYTLGDSTYQESGSYENSFIAANGCDSIVQLNLFVDILDGTVDFSKEINLTYFPNPFNDNFSLQFELAQSEALSIALYDVRGVRIDQLQTYEVISSGSHIYTFSNASLPQGVYLLHFKLADRNLTFRMIKI